MRKSRKKAIGSGVGSVAIGLCQYLLDRFGVTIPQWTDPYVVALTIVFALLAIYLWFKQDAEEGNDPYLSRKSQRRARRTGQRPCCERDS